MRHAKNDITSPIAWITFDAVGTLIRPYPGVGAVYSAVMATHGLAASVAAVEARFRAVFKDYARYRKAHPVTPDDRAFWRAIVHDCVAPWALNADARNAIFEQLYKDFSLSRHWRIIPGAVKTLETLKARGYRLALLSNADERFHAVMAGLGLSDYFETLFLSGEVGYEKPDLRIFRHVERACAVSPQQLCHVGDSIPHDIEGAHAAGWQAVQVGDEAPLAIADFPNYLIKRPNRDGDLAHA